MSQSPMSFRLNPAQRDAVRCVDAPCLVLAGAGSGKTRVIVQKIAHLLGHAGMPAESIAALTFTNKAAAEMKERVATLVDATAQNGLTVSTFHSLGVRIIRAEARELGLKSRFSILDADDCYNILQDLAATTDKQAIRAIQHTISLWKNALLDPDTALAQAQNDQAAHTARVYRNYAATLGSYQAVDFDDLIRLPAELFTRSAEVRRRWQEKLRYVLVDEVQDTNACQYQLLKHLVGETGAFTAVGDDDQAIYAWRGATLDNLRQLQRDFPELVVVTLEQNYRSSQRILQAANTLISCNPKLYPKKLWSEHGLGDPIVVTPMQDEETEAESVVIKIMAHRFERKTKHSDYAILYRGNHQARIFEQALRKERIPYVLSGGQSFFDRAEIKDLIAYLRLILNSDDDPAFIRAVTTPKRGVGAATLEVLGALAGERHASLFESVYSDHLHSRLAPRQHEPLKAFCDFINNIEIRATREPAGQVMDDLLKAIDYEAYLHDAGDDRSATTRWENVLDFRNWLAKRSDAEGTNFMETAQQIAILSMLDRGADDADAVRLSTLHAAKGLEFPHVFLVGVEEGLLPHAGGNDDDVPADQRVARIEEERRLMYVGITRAQRSLHLSYCKKRKRARDFIAREPSRFIQEMGLDQQPASPANPINAKTRLADLKALLQKVKTD